MAQRKKGRPVASTIRQNIVELLYYMKEGYGYDIYKHYIKIFPKATMRSIYYNLKKGLSLDEFKVSQIKVEKGEFSWGSQVEKRYYTNGPNAKPQANDLVKKHFENKKL